MMSLHTHVRAHTHTCTQVTAAERTCWLSFCLSSHQFGSVQSLSRVRLFATPWIVARQASLSITNSWSLLKLMPVESVMPSSHLILCRPLLLLPSIPPSIRVFSNDSKYWSFSFSISPSNEHPGLMSFRMDWLDALTWLEVKDNAGQNSWICLSPYLSGVFFFPPIKARRTYK